MLESLSLEKVMGKKALDLNSIIGELRTELHKCKFESISLKELF
ncbi:MAG: hypothetical protein U0457_18245 [Candidatus Sericytochromatia bacterium]